MKILIADDDLDMIQMIQKTIEWKKLGIEEILISYNGLHARKVIEEQKPELVLCEVEIPLCDGIQVLEWIREKGVETALIFLSCHESFSFVQRALRLGAADYLTKPFSVEELQRVLWEIVQVCIK